jgi:hypothetical protein
MAFLKQHWEEPPGATTGTYATQFDIDASTVNQGGVINITATGNIRIDIPTNGTAGQLIRYVITASGGARTLTLESGILNDGLYDSGGGAGVIASGKIRLVDLLCTDGTVWVVAQDTEFN